MNISLRQIKRPDWSIPMDQAQPEIPLSEYEQRLTHLYQSAQCRWVVVYADREHSANMVFLTRFDPRFEEALLILGPNQERVLIVGNEGLGYVSQARPVLTPMLCQSLSLMGQPREASTRLDTVLRKIGLQAGDRVGVVGWKYLEQSEDEECELPAFVPAFVLHQLQRIVGEQNILDSTSVLMHPVHGLKSNNSAAQIAAFEWAAVHVSATVQRVLQGIRPGQTEAEAGALLGYCGLPMSCHPMLNSASAGEPLIGLRSPGVRKIKPGDAVSIAFGYWGSLGARGGLLQAEPDLDFFERYVTPYYRAIAVWYQTLRVGMGGGDMYTGVMAALEGAPFKPALNPGHLVSFDEWSHTPIRENSTDILRSGMALQCDIIPSPMPDGWTLNCEDTVALADEQLRADLARDYPAVWQRIQERRHFMHTELGLVLDESVLPLSNTPAVLAPFWLAPDQVCSVTV